MKTNKMDWVIGGLGYVFLILLFVGVFLAQSTFFRIFMDEFVVLPLLSLVMVGLVIARLWHTPELGRGVWLFHGISIIIYALIIFNVSNFKHQELTNWHERLDSSSDWLLRVEMLKEFISSLAFIAGVGVAAVGAGLVTVAVSGERWAKRD